jgi:hypothetical protein
MKGNRIDPFVFPIFHSRRAGCSNRLSNSAVAFDESLKRLDQVVAILFGMSQEHLEYIISAMTTDGSLKQLRPSYEHRGIRIQPYAGGITAATRVK